MRGEPQQPLEGQRYAATLIHDIRAAFASTPFPSAAFKGEPETQIQWLKRVFDENALSTLSTLSQEREWLPLETWALDFTGLSADAAQYVLPRLLLVVLLEWVEWPEEYFYAADAATVVQLLDVNSHLSEEVRAGIYRAQNRGDWLAAFDNVRPGLAQHKARPLQGLSQPQIETVVRWIELVQTSPLMEFHAGNLQSALDYWTGFLMSARVRRIKKT